MLFFKKTIKNPLSGTEGFSLVELIVVIVMVGVLATIAVVNYIPLRKKAYDTTAMIDARNIIDAVTTAMLNGESVDYNKPADTGGFVGELDAGLIPRAEAVYVLSPGVKAVVMTGDSRQGPNGTLTFFSAVIYHENGTIDTSPGNLSGRKEYTCGIDETTGITTMP